jgi:hypothetical protein
MSTSFVTGVYKSVLNTRLMNLYMTIIDDELGQRMFRSNDNWASSACMRLGVFQCASALSKPSFSQLNYPTRRIVKSRRMTESLGRALHFLANDSSCETIIQMRKACSSYTVV